MAKRLFNFSAGPAALPDPVLEEARDNLLSLGDLGAGVMEISHRSKQFEAIITEAEGNLRRLLNISEEYDVLFLQGGASLQFCMAPMNLLGADQIADYIITGVWSQKAIAEAKKFGKTHVVATTEPDNFTHLPDPADFQLTEGAAYVHLTTNNTIFGTQWATEPDVGDALFVADASSDILSRPMDLRKYGMIYAGAQKNLGPSGVALIIIRKDWVDRAPDDLPSMMSYKVHSQNGSLFNTPPSFGVYLVHLVLKWLLDQGGVEGIQKINDSKAAKLYGQIDSSEFYRGTAETGSRSKMNVTFRLPSEALETKFIAEAAGRNLYALKGHRSVGGIRASIYNAVRLEAVDALTAFMADFEKRNG